MNWMRVPGHVNTFLADFINENTGRERTICNYCRKGQELERGRENRHAQLVERRQHRGRSLPYFC